MAVHEPQQHQTTLSDLSRRGFLFALGVVLNAIAATLVAIPIIPTTSLLCIGQICPCRIAVLRL